MFSDPLISSRFPAPFTSASCSATQQISKPDFLRSLLPPLYRRFSPWLLPICRSKVRACQPVGLLPRSGSSGSGQEERDVRLSDDTSADSVLLGVGGEGGGGVAKGGGDRRTCFNWEMTKSGQNIQDLKQRRIELYLLVGDGTASC